MAKQRSFIPGPTPVPEAVALAAARAPLHHRGSEFSALLHRVQEQLRAVFCTAHPVLTFASSGTGAAEAVITNLFSPGDTALYINNGRFAARWGAMMRTFGMQTVEIPVPWGVAADPAEVEAAVRAYPEARCVWVVHSETSTGVRNDIRALAEVVHRSSQALLCVDAVTSLGAEECRTDDWELDVVITASQKALMTPPGLAFAALGPRAWQAAEQARLPHYYFNLLQERKRLDEGTTMWTPPVTLVAALHCALDMILEEGLDRVWQRHTRMGSALRAGLDVLGMPALGTPASDAVTVALLPQAGEHFRTLLRHRYGMIVAGGQEHLKGRAFRVAHMGYCDEGDILALLSAMERALADTCSQVAPGEAVAAAQRSLHSLRTPVVQEEHNT